MSYSKIGRHWVLWNAFVLVLSLWILYAPSYLEHSVFSKNLYRADHKSKAPIISIHSPIRIPLIRFRFEGQTPDEKFYLFSYFLDPRLAITGKNQVENSLTLKWISPPTDQNLSATTEQNWNHDHLYQLDAVTGRLLINVRVEEFRRFHKAILTLTLPAMKNESANAKSI